MLSREDAMFTIGFEGLMAVVDAKARSRYRKFDTMQLAEAGLFRAAFTSALYSEKAADFENFAAWYNRRAGTTFTSKEQFMRLFGVKQEATKRVLAL